MSPTFKILQGEALSIMQKLNPASFTCVITDPPYLGFGFKKEAADYMQKFLPYLAEMKRLGGISTRLAISQPPGRLKLMKEHLPPGRILTLDDAFNDKRGAAAHFYLVNPLKKEVEAAEDWPNDVVPESIHPNDRDVGQMSILVKMMSQPNDTIFDPFCGSAAIGVAAVLLGRNYVGIELVPDRVKDAETRLSAALAVVA